MRGGRRILEVFSRHFQAAMELPVVPADWPTAHCRRIANAISSHAGGLLQRLYTPAIITLAYDLLTSAPSQILSAVRSTSTHSLGCGPCRTPFPTLLERRSMLKYNKHTGFEWTAHH
ncbi:hypothetical protein CBOM_05669 [Ceraceosorus bombacis]|uniref:Uncharacterized protein n=1 Tax=Ceraceosorus bombacis TaxID=401625 RepID=A0A0P1BQR4_9BASI|nr:hypothetical protein CBOM_05669 [Ceraceosorus bombacis]